MHDAFEKHHGQIRTLTKESYISHPVEVADKARSIGLDIIHQIAAILHDVVEDCFDDVFTGISDIKKNFGSEVASIVLELTDPDKNEFSSREAFKQAVRDKSGNNSGGAQSLKCLDISHNLFSIILLKDPDFAKKYLLESELFYSVLVSASPEAKLILRNRLDWGYKHLGLVSPKDASGYFKQVTLLDGRTITYKDANSYNIDKNAVYSLFSTCCKFTRDWGEIRNLLHAFPEYARDVTGEVIDRRLMRVPDLRNFHVQKLEGMDGSPYKLWRDNDGVFCEAASIADYIYLYLRAAAILNDESNGWERREEVVLKYPFMGSVEFLYPNGIESYRRSKATNHTYNSSNVPLRQAFIGLTILKCCYNPSSVICLLSVYRAPDTIEFSPEVGYVVFVSFECVKHRFLISANRYILS